MTAKILKTFRREVEISGAPYTVAIGPSGFKLTKKGYRIGDEVTWSQVVQGVWVTPPKTARTTEKEK